MKKKIQRMDEPFFDSGCFSYVRIEYLGELIKEQAEILDKLIEIKTENAPEWDFGYKKDFVNKLIKDQYAQIMGFFNELNNYCVRKYGPDKAYTLKYIVEKKGGAQ